MEGKKVEKILKVHIEVEGIEEVKQLVELLREAFLLYSALGGACKESIGEEFGKVNQQIELSGRG